MTARAYVGLGSNVGDGRAQIAAALARLATLPETTLARASSCYESEPWGASAQWYVNAVAALDTTLDPPALLRGLLAIEAAMGRRRVAEEHWAPRPIDLDLLLYDDRVVDLPDLRVPHPAMHERRFVLVPLAELAPAAVHPTSGATIAALLAGVADRKFVRRLPPV